jgi:hypothetical protein
MLIWGCPELSVLSSDTLDDQSIYEPRKNILSGPQCGHHWKMDDIRKIA